MDLKTFNRCMDLIRSWRERTEKYDTEWPDSRDPDLHDFLSEFKVVPQDLEKSMAALAAWREAGEDVYQNQSTIAHVIRNRQKKGLFRSHLTWSLQKQFSSMTEEDDPRLNLYPDESQPLENFKRLLENLDMILESKSLDLTQGATYFGAVGPTMEPWFRDIVQSTNYERTVQVGRYTFYRERK